MPDAIFAFEVSVGGTGWRSTVNARTRGQAKALYYQDLRDPWPNIPFTALRCHKLGPPHTSERFKHNATYRGMSDVQCGQRVRVGAAGRGTIAGHNSSANFDVLFDQDSPRYPGMKMNVHPSEITLEDSARG